MKHHYTHSRFLKIFATLSLIVIGATANATTHHITASDFVFTPNSVTASLGDTIQWDWITGSHTTTSLTIPGGATPWDHPLNSQDGNGSFIYVPSVNGTYNYECSIHVGLGMTGSFSVGCSPPTAEEAAITASGPTTYCKGSAPVLTVATPGLTYQWKKGNTVQSGATLQSFTPKNSGSYKCNVSNSCGTTTSNTISVTQNPLPTSSVSQSPCSGGAVLLTCTFTPSSGVTLQWRKGTTDISGATNSTYSATSKGTYKCLATITATGCTKLSGGSKVTITCRSGEVVNDNEVIVYPNPTADYFNISTSLDAKSVIYIYDLTGRLVESHEVSGSEMKVGAALSNGVYFLKIATNNQALQVIKLVKNL
ncbi:MAG TPA: T9SS type A sorting domain-containing protein [Chitinophagales bacterium]|nr:T9SS type A sorting domain-containing protein [Chitinophagales bacterium]